MNEPFANAEPTRKSFESVDSGARIIVHEMLYNDDKTVSVSLYSAVVI